MDWTEVSYRYDGSFAGFLTCVYEAYVNREAPADFRPEGCPLCSLYPERTGYRARKVSVKPTSSSWVSLARSWSEKPGLPRLLLGFFRSIS